MSKPNVTETLDKLYLEWSQFTKAKTAKEIELEDKYNELLFAVGSKFPNETRHQTALRYIREREEHKCEDTYQAKERINKL